MFGTLLDEKETGIMVSPVCRPICCCTVALARIYGLKLLRNYRVKVQPGDWFQSIWKKHVPHATNASLNPMECRKKIADLFDDANDRRSISLDIGSYIATLAREDCLGDLDVFSVFFEEEWMVFPNVSVEMESWMSY